MGFYFSGIFCNSTFLFCRSYPFHQFMLRRQHAELVKPVTNERILKACAQPGWTSYRETRIWQILGCRQLNGGAIDRHSIRSILAEDRLVPGIRFSERN